jgi:hypothetical protein
MRRLQPGDLSRRDIAVLRDLARLRLLTGSQLERLHFAGLASKATRGSARRRSLGRLAGLGLVATLPRRVGGERAGSAGLVYTLDARAQRERSLWQTEAGPLATGRRSRRPWAVGWLFVSHNLDVAELYVRLRESARTGQLRLLRFDSEPTSWFATCDGSLKPDAYVVVETAGWERHWWIEVDRGTESLPTVHHKLRRYVDVLRSGRPGPEGVLPRVVVTTPSEHRAEQIQTIIDRLQAGDDFLSVVDFDSALQQLAPGAGRRAPTASSRLRKTGCCEFHRSQN